MLTEFFRRLAVTVRLFAEQVGGPGLAIVAFLDSSLLSLPEVNDVLVVLLALEHPDEWWYYPIFTTAGSLGGCYLLYRLGRRGGEALVARRFRAGQVERALRAFRRYGPFAIVIPSLLPPPMPFKVFVLLAGASGVPARAFLMAVAFGRGVRYFGQAFLAHRYGGHARDLFAGHLPAIAIAVVVGGSAVWGWRLLWLRSRRA